MLRELPHDEEIERAVLGVALFDPDSAPEIVAAVSPTDFYGQANKAAFGALAALTRAGISAGVLEVTQELRSKGLLEGVGGMAYLTSVCESVFTSANVDFFCTALVDLANRRRLVRAGQQIAEAAMNGGDVADLMDKAEAAVCAVRNRRKQTETRHIAAVSPEVFEAVERNYDGDNAGIISTGLQALDEMMGGGFRESELVVVAGRPGMGKSAFCGDLASHVAGVQGKPVIVFTLEMSDRQLAQRLLAKQARINGKTLQLGSLRDDQWPMLNAAIAAVNKWPLFLNDDGDMSPMRMRAECRRVHTETPLGLIIVDYIGLLDSDGGGGSNDNRVNEVSRITRSLKRMAKEFAVPVIALSQLNRGVEARTNKRPMLADLRESGSVEQDADKVLLLYRDEYYYPATKDEKGNEIPNPDAGTAEIIVAKHRNGEVGTVKVAFDKALTSFGSLELRPAQPGTGMWRPGG